MSILSYIIPNIIIALILVVGVIQGQKRGWKKSLIKLGYTLALAVGSFFLSTFVIVPAIAKLGEFGGYVLLFSTAVWMILFVLLMFVAELIFVLVCHKLDKTAQANRKEKKLAKKVDVTKKTKEAKKSEKENAREQRKALKAKRKEEAKVWRKAHKKSRVFGGIIGFVGSLVLSVMAMLFVGHIGIGLATVLPEESLPVAETIVDCYNNSAIGLLDSAIMGEDASLGVQLYAYEIANGTPASEVVEGE